MDLLNKIDMFVGNGYELSEEETAWQKHIKKELNGRNLGDMDDEETKKFFAQAKKSYKGGTNEGELTESYVLEMSAAEKEMYAIGAVDAINPTMGQIGMDFHDFYEKMKKSSKGRLKIGRVEFESLYNKALALKKGGMKAGSIEQELIKSLH